MAEEGQQQETEKTEEQKPNGLIDEARQNAPEEWLFSSVSKWRFSIFYIA